jgi:hypothetical protein
MNKLMKRLKQGEIYADSLSENKQDSSNLPCWILNFIPSQSLPPSLAASQACSPHKRANQF